MCNSTPLNGDPVHNADVLHDVEGDVRSLRDGMKRMIRFLRLYEGDVPLRLVCIAGQPICM